MVGGVAQGVQGKFHSRTERVLDTLRVELVAVVERLPEGLPTGTRLGRDSWTPERRLTANHGLPVTRAPPDPARAAVATPSYRMGLQLQTLMCHYAKSGEDLVGYASAASAAAAAAEAARWIHCAVAVDWLGRWVLGRKGTRIRGKRAARASTRSAVAHLTPGGLACVHQSAQIGRTSRGR